MDTNTTTNNTDTTTAAPAAAPSKNTTTTRDSRLADASWLAAMYVDAHCSLAYIGSITSSKESDVAAALKAAGITLRAPSASRQRFDQLRNEEYMVDALTKRHLTLRAVAREIGCSEQVVGEATRKTDLAAALAAAGWDKMRNAAPTRTGRMTVEHIPDGDELIEVVTIAAHGYGWATVAMVLDVAGLGIGQTETVTTRLTKLCAQGRLEHEYRKPVPQPGRTPHAYRPAQAAVAQAS